MGVALTIQIFREQSLVGQEEFRSEDLNTLKIGRMSSAQLRLEDPRVSRIHAVIEFSGGDASVIDMGSTVGTLVNGDRVHKHKLVHGDELKFGDTIVVVGFDGPAKAMNDDGAANDQSHDSAQDLGPAFSSAHDSGPSPAAKTQVDTQIAHQVGQQNVAQQVGASVAAPTTAASTTSVSTTVTTATHATDAESNVPLSARQTQRDDEGLLPEALQSPVFDGGLTEAEPFRRIDNARLLAAAVESRPHPSLPPEPKLSHDTRFLEVRLYWGEVLLRVNHYYKPKRITLGEVKGTDFFISSEGLPQETFPLVRTIEDEYILTFSQGMEGEVEIEGAIRSFEQLRASSIAHKDPELEGSYRVSLPVHAKVLVHWGGATFAMRFAPPPAAAVTQSLKSLPPLDFPYLNSLTFSGFLHALLVLAMILAPRQFDVLNDFDLMANEDTRMIQAFLAPPEEKRDERVIERVRQMQKAAADKRPEQNTESAPKKPKTLADSAGGAKKSKAVKQFDAFFSGGGLGSAGANGGAAGITSGDLANVIGTAGPKGIGALAGFNAKGVNQTGGGFGGTIGVAGIGPSGLGGAAGGGGLGWGPGSRGKPGFGGVGGKRPDDGFSFGDIVTKGALPREVIQRVINQNKGAIRYCYERELEKDSSLQGRLVMDWIIAATGKVARVRVAVNQVGSPAVGRCVAAKIKEWVFPQPSGGGVVQVQYPFVLSPAS